MSEFSDTKPQPRPVSLRFSLKSILWLIVVFALAMSCLVQTWRVRDAEVALARHSWAYGNEHIPAVTFRLLVNRLFDNDDMKVVVIRFEAIEEHFVTADGAGCRTAPSEDGPTHWAEIRVVASFDSMANHLTTLTQVKSESGTAGGRIIYPLRQDQDPKGFMAIDVKPGVYDLKQSVELYGKPDGMGILSVK
jgi:hypothetical protein